MRFTRTIYCDVYIEDLVDEAIEHGFKADDVNEISFFDFIDDYSIDFSTGDDFDLRDEEIEAIEQACREEFLKRFDK